MIPLGEWTPDRPDFQNGLTVADGVIADTVGYKIFPGMSSSAGSGSPPTTAVGGAFHSEDQPSTFAADGTNYAYAGTSTKLHRLTIGSTWADVTRATGGDYASGQWKFAKFGNRIIAVNGADVPQSYVEGSSTDFAALAGSPPSTARAVAVVRDFVVMAPIGSTLYWSAINDPTDWTPSATTQCDTQVIPDGSYITGLAGGEFGLVFMENAIYRMTYVGSPLIFQFDKVTSLLGLPNNTPIAQHEDMVFFHSGEGFYIIKGGQNVIPIGEGKVNRYFSAVTGSEGSSEIQSCAADAYCKTFVVQFTHTVSDATTNHLLVYHWPTGRWTHVDLDDTGLATPPHTFFPVKYGAARTLGAFAGAELVSFSGGGSAATIETGEMQIFPGRRAFVSGVRPIIEGTDFELSSVQAGARSTPYGTVSYAPQTTPNSSGLYPLRSSGLFHRVKIEILSADSSFIASGFDFEAVPEGTR